MGTKCHAFFRYLTQFVQAKNLKPARVSEDRARPRHETMQPTQVAHLFHAGAQVEVISISQKDLRAEFFEDVLRNSLDRCNCADRHEYRRFDDTVWSGEASQTGSILGRVNLKGNGHQKGL